MGTINVNQNALDWFDHTARPFLEKNAPEKLPALQQVYDRLANSMDQSTEVTICFLGNSAVGKSSLVNALAADATPLLPAGGVGPLTAQATEVFYSEAPHFHVTYHAKKPLWETAFVLEARLIKDKKLDQQALVDSLEKLNEVLSSDEKTKLVADTSIDQEILYEEETKEEQIKEEESTLEQYIKQAKTLIRGNQFDEKVALDYLVDALRLACGSEKKWGSTIEQDDQERINRIKDIFFEKNREFEIKKEGNSGFYNELKNHSAGFLSPLIEKIRVGWPSDLLKSGVRLVDLPGIGVAKDNYRQTTRDYISNKANAIVLVVDRAGPTSATIDLLRGSGYWDRLVGTSDNLEGDGCSMLLAITRLDDIAQAKRQELINQLEPGSSQKPKKREIYLNLVEEIKPKMRDQLALQLKSMGSSENENVRKAREIASSNILNQLEVHPVCAPELVRIIQDDDDDKSFLKIIEETGIPSLRHSFEKIAFEKYESHKRSLDVLRRSLISAAVNELNIINVKWKKNTQVAKEVQLISHNMENFLREKQRGYELDKARFFGFLTNIRNALIKSYVNQAVLQAEKEINKYLNGPRGIGKLQWNTLNAAVKRNGSFKSVNFIRDISNCFQEPIAAIWSQELLVSIKKESKNLVNSLDEIVKDISKFKDHNQMNLLDKDILEFYQLKLDRISQQIDAIGLEGTKKLRSTVKEKVEGTIRIPVENTCKEFVLSERDLNGSGKKRRIIDLFDSLAKKVVEKAEAPMFELLTNNAEKVFEKIKIDLNDQGDPLQEIIDIIISPKFEVAKSLEECETVLDEINRILETAPSYN